MSGTNHRTWQVDHRAHLVTTVQLDPITGGRSDDRQNELPSVAEQLIDLMDRLRLPTTWAMSDPAHSAAAARIRRSAVPHELAILGDGDWLGPMAGRTRFARELSRRVEQARATGLAVHTLVPRVAIIDDNLDLLVKQQITAVAGACTDVDPLPTTSSPKALHFGVWEIPFSGKLPARSGWFSDAGRSTLRRIAAAAKAAAIFHMLIDASLLCDQGPAAQKSVTWLMERVSALRDRGLIRVETLRTTSARLSSVPAIKPQQSILRRAA